MFKILKEDLICMLSIQIFNTIDSSIENYISISCCYTLSKNVSNQHLLKINIKTLYSLLGLGLKIIQGFWISRNQFQSRRDPCCKRDMKKSKSFQSRVIEHQIELFPIFYQALSKNAATTFNMSSLPFQLHSHMS